MKIVLWAATAAVFLLPSAGKAQHDFQPSVIEASVSHGKPYKTIRHIKRSKHKKVWKVARNRSYGQGRAIQTAVTYRPLDPYEFGAFIDIPPEVIEYLPKTVINEILVAQAKAYLIRTTIPGGTMLVYGRRLVKAGLATNAQQAGIEHAIGMLHDVYAIRLARAVRQARREGLNIGVFSAYRDPSLGIGGFRYKEDSTHAAGIATDMYGITSAKIAKRWQEIANANGLFLPYGPHNRAERNHTQLLMIASTKDRPALRKMIVTYRKKSIPVVVRRELWAASGVAPDKLEPASVQQVSYFGGRHRYTKRSIHRSRIVHHRRYARA